MYGDTIKDNGVTLDLCVCFIDGTISKIERPSGLNYFLGSCYSGHKMFHCLLIQTCNTPEDFTQNMYGTHEGTTNDLIMYRNSVVDRIMSNAFTINKRKFYNYGDQAHVLKT